ncbi:MFS transporter [Streptomyces sp. CMB-StM0423]|uniref:MFS transporter n=1 Tax=Streptomyces sp. CMB-StM0423 TaxID=2059884 RepID=UPI000C701F75|nr:MFS transporter [Streptomyces sp. CMB-StM0423]AUH45243.1 MFS transporter [Streptomyces sp. CMB-StM0423]
MRTYRELFRTPEFTPLFAASSLQVAGLTISGLALGTHIYEQTGSPLLSALAMFGPSLAQVLGATLLLSAADRVPPRGAMTALALVLAVATAAQAAPGLPVWAAFAILLCLGLLASVGGGVRYGLLNEILPRDGYLLGRSVVNMSAGAMQIAGFAVGGVLVTALSPRGTLLVAAAAFLAGAAVARAGLGRRAPRTAGRPSVAETWRVNGLLWSSRHRRTLYLALWLPNGLVVGAESQFVPYEPDRAGVLLALSALGMLTGDVLAGRVLPARWRPRLGVPLLLLLAAPYLVFALRPPLAVAAVAVTVAAAGFAASLVQQERLMALTPDELSGQALGLHTSGMLTMQGVAAALAGGIAEVTSPATAMAAMAALSIAVTLALTPGLRAAGAASAAGAAGAASAAGPAGAAVTAPAQDPAPRPPGGGGGTRDRESGVGPRAPRA